VNTVPLLNHNFQPQPLHLNCSSGFALDAVPPQCGHFIVQVCVMVFLPIFLALFGDNAVNLRCESPHYREEVRVSHGEEVCRQSEAYELFSLHYHFDSGKQFVVSIRLQDVTVPIRES
jgi:hypothetical protein